ncbi:MAG: ThuA domain-containing protein [Planctomycetota bacterium]
MKHYVLSAVMFCVILPSLLPGAVAESDSGEVLELLARNRVTASESSKDFKIIYEENKWEPTSTAIIVCDMWAEHWCKSASRRVAEMAPRVDQFVKRARDSGVFIVHAPSGGMDHYADHPARKRARSAPRAANLPEGIGSWCRQIESEEGAQWPIDQDDGGCDDQPSCPQEKMDQRQIGVIEIHDGDAISDSGEEVWNLFEQRGIENVMLVGVHTNMCVMGRPFGLRNMVRFGKQTVLVRDLTDTMYNPRRRPFVSHVRGTELIVEYIEKHICPTILSTDLLDSPAHRFSEDDRPYVAFLVSDDHYDADKTLPPFAERLRERYGCRCTVLHGLGDSDIHLTAELEVADCLVLYIRRLALPQRQLQRVRKYLESGNPLVGLRTASHAFDVRGKHEAGQAEWPEFDPQVLGGNYHGHGPNARGTDVAIVPEQSDHAVLDGVKPAEWHSTGSLYYTSSVAKDATVLMTGSLDDRVEPLTWIRPYGNARIFYSALGHPDDFDQPAFRQLLVNAVFWALDRPVPEACVKRKAEGKR